MFRDTDAPMRTASWRLLLEREGQHRLVLLANHVLASETAAWQRLQPHAGRTLRIRGEGWPALIRPWLPQPQPMTVRVTPAGLLELAGEGGAGNLGDVGDAGHSVDPRGSGLGTASAQPVDLEVVVDTHDPAGLVARVLSGGTPSLQLAGDAQLAADVNWLAENIRWDVAADLERFFGPVSAERLRLWGLAVMKALQEAVQRLATRGQGS